MSCPPESLEVVQWAQVIVGASLPVEIDIFDLCARLWRANEDVVLLETIRPTVAIGLAAECTTAGTTSAREPRWPKQAGAVVTDGSAQWTMVAAGLNGINVATSPTASVEPSTGLTVSAVSVSEGRKLLATYAGTTEGDYVVTFAFTVDGKARAVRQRVLVE